MNYLFDEFYLEFICALHGKCVAELRYLYDIVEHVWESTYDTVINCN